MIRILIFVLLSSTAFANVIIEPGGVIIHDTRVDDVSDGYRHQITIDLPTRTLIAYHCDENEHFFEGATAIVDGRCRLVVEYNHAVKKRKTGGLFLSFVSLANTIPLTFIACEFGTSNRYPALFGSVVVWRVSMNFACNEN